MALNFVHRISPFSSIQHRTHQISWISHPRQLKRPFTKTPRKEKVSFTGDFVELPFKSYQALGSTNSATKEDRLSALKWSINNEEVETALSLYEELNGVLPASGFVTRLVPLLCDYHQVDQAIKVYQQNKNLIRDTRKQRTILDIIRCLGKIRGANPQIEFLTSEGVKDPESWSEIANTLKDCNPSSFTSLISTMEQQSIPISQKILCMLWESQMNNGQTADASNTMQTIEKMGVPSLSFYECQMRYNFNSGDYQAAQNIYRACEQSERHPNTTMKLLLARILKSTDPVGYAKITSEFQDVIEKGFTESTNKQ